MLEVHHKGSAVCGIFTYEVAESKVAKVIKYAKDNGHPLKCSLEPEE
jgi:ATP-dependent Clp protease adaptor protein ClpS